MRTRERRHDEDSERDTGDNPYKPGSDRFWQYNIEERIKRLEELVEEHRRYFPAGFFDETL